MNTPGTDTAGSAPSDSSSILGAEIGALLGEGSWDDGPADSGTSVAADAPSAERQDTPASADASPEGLATAERPGEPPGDAATATAPDPNAAPSPASADEDILAGATPATYTVNGEQRQFDGIKVLKDGIGAIVEGPDAVQLLLRRLGERDHLFEQNQTREKRYQDLERLTEWRGKGSDGKDTVLKGAEALQMRDVGLSMMRAEIAELRAMFDKPPATWLAQDEQGNIVWNTDAFRDWNRGLDQARKIAYHEGQNAFRSVLAQTQAPPPPPTSLTPDQVQALVPQAINFAAQQAGITNLTQESKAFLSTVVRPYLRAALPADVQANPSLKLGQPVVDPDFIEVVKQQAAQQARVAQTATTLADANKQNQARLAQAAAGTRARVAAAPAAKAPTEDQSRAERSDKLWALSEAAVSGRRSA